MNLILTIPTEKHPGNFLKFQDFSKNQPYDFPRKNKNGFPQDPSNYTVMNSSKVVWRNILEIFLRTSYNDFSRDYCHLSINTS